jgi:hypothetical protein
MERLLENFTLVALLNSVLEVAEYDWTEKFRREIMYRDKVILNEIDGACGTHGRGEKSVRGFGERARRKETTWKTKA